MDKRRLMAAGLLTLSAILPIGARQADLPEEPGLAIVHPRQQAPVLGPTQIELSLAPAVAAAVQRVELRVDGVLLATLTSPPWRAGWKPGDASRAHTIEAVAHLRDGRALHATTRTSGLHVDQVEKVDLVNLYAIVQDRGGRYVTDLQSEHFSVLENGRPQKIERMSMERKPLRVALVLDASNTMGRGRGERLKSAQRAALEFLDVLAPRDQGMVVAFNDSVKVVQDLTADVRLLAQAIGTVKARGGTALYDAVWTTAQKLREAEGRRVLILLSDGKDESYNGLEPGSLHTLSEALDQTLRREVILFAIGIGGNLEKDCVFSMRPLSDQVSVCPGGTVVDALRALAESTGGRALISPSTARLHQAFQDVANDLRNQYAIAYVSDDPRRNGGWREIHVSVPGRELEVITRKGYYGPRDVLPPRSAYP